MSKTILTQVNGWTPLIDALVQEYGIVTASVFGRVWRYCQLADGVCRASTETIAADLGLTRQGIAPHLDKLVQEGYLKDLTPDVRNRPHRYQDTGKAQILSVMYAEIVQQREQAGVNEIDTKEQAGVNEIDTKEQAGVNEIDSTVNEIDTQVSTNFTPGVNDVYKKILFKRVKERTNKDNGGSCLDFPLNGGTQTPRSAWRTITDQLKFTMERKPWDDYVKTTALIEYDPKLNAFVFLCPTAYARDWMEDRMTKTLERSLTGACNAPARVEFVVEGIT